MTSLRSTPLHAPGGARLPVAGDGPGVGFPHWPRWRTLVVFLLTLAAVAALWLWQEYTQRAAIAGLEAGQRARAYAQAMGTLESLCTPQVAPGMDATCRQQARLVLDFPECDAHCAALARPLAGPIPSR